MTNEQITQWAREACIALLVHHDGTQVTPQELQAFATLVRNATLEEAAVKCDELVHDDGAYKLCRHGAYLCSEKIRSMK